MDTIITKLSPLIIGLIVLVIVVKVLFEIVLPRVIRNWRIKQKFSAGAKWRTDREFILWLQGMKPHEFEMYVAEMFRRLGYRAEAVGKSHDGGIDVIIEKDGEKSYVQCKKFITSKVTVGNVRDFYGALVDKLASGQGYFITTNTFTLEARQFAEDKPIELIDGFSLVKYARMVYEEAAVKELPLAKQCPECGAELVEKSGRYGKFFGCSTYPKCDYTESL